MNMHKSVDFSSPKHDVSLNNLKVAMDFTSPRPTALAEKQLPKL